MYHYDKLRDGLESSLVLKGAEAAKKLENTHECQSLIYIK